MTQFTRKVYANPVESITTDTARAAAVALFRELADKLESGELEGARVQWREGLHHAEIVERLPDCSRLRRVELYSAERPIDYNEPNIGEERTEEVLAKLDLDQVTAKRRP